MVLTFPVGAQSVLLSGVAYGWLSGVVGGYVRR
ncbi:hypothetical protein STRAU_5093 [Streptomyces aurantiacus JA 4570]|uniref:Uncharacterized protein n=1 Tax=Streptomyces aurantiacus JA 4570 TaxID=1286094 RepID=S3ZDS4_9ACTN|nr:hypothetical protein STRAU_5093 [Streptomyces aurantiacus JA 4570]